MKKPIVFGMDVGFIKTGFAVFELDAVDKLLFTTTLKSDSAKEKNNADYVAFADVNACVNAINKWIDLFAEFKPAAIFAEIPPGGAQGARANRCMGMSTGLMAAFLAERPCSFELYLPSDVEKALDAKITPGERKARGLTKSQATAWKKERLQSAALAAFPDFKNWPTTKELAEDSYDAVCAFLCGRHHAHLYNAIKKLPSLASFKLKKGVTPDE